MIDGFGDECESELDEFGSASIREDDENDGTNGSLQGNSDWNGPHYF